MLPYLLGSKSHPNSLLSTPPFRLQAKADFDSIRKQTSAQNGLEKITKACYYTCDIITKVEVIKNRRIF